MPKLNYVPPPKSTSDLVDSANGQTVVSGDLYNPPTVRSDQPNPFIGKSGLTEICSATNPALYYLVQFVVQTCSQKQVIGPNARSVVALVQHAKPVGDWSVMEFPRNTVSAFGSLVGSKLSISATVAASGPRPTRIGFLNVSPEPLSARRWLNNVAKRAAALHRTVLSCRQTAWRYAKRCTANVACLCYFRSSHDLNLRRRLGLWSGSFGVQPSFEPLVF